MTDFTCRTRCAVSRFAPLLRRLAAATTASLGLLAGADAAAQGDADYPNRPLKMIVASAAGGILDTVGRTVASGLSESLGQQVVVENRPGAGGTVGTEALLTAPADGYLLGKIATSHAINPSVYKKLPYETTRDFVPISQTVNLTNMLVAHPSLPASNIAELLALAKAKPRTITYGSAGNGQSNHLSGALLASMAGIDLIHVPYKGSSAALVDVLSGNISMMFVDVLSAMPHVKSGKLKVLAVTGLKRSAAVPEYPTVSESGVPGFNGNSWLGLIARAGTPKAIVDRLSTQTSQVLNSPEVRKRLLAAGVEPVGSTSAEFAAFIEAEMPRWAQAVKVSGAKVD
jgi:tripartite-type tricarboxylate transporter receptor subunit TctC